MRAGVPAFRHRSAAADGVEDVDLVACQCGVQSIAPFCVLAADKNVDMLAYLALLIENAIAEPDVLLPKRFECLADGCKLARQIDLDLAVGKGFEMTA